MKQTLLDIKRKTDVTTQALAERTRLSTTDVYIVEVGGFTTQEKVQQVLTAFNQLSGMHVTPEEINYLLPQAKTSEEVKRA